MIFRDQVITEVVQRVVTNLMDEPLLEQILVEAIFEAYGVEKKEGKVSEFFQRLKDEVAQPSPKKMRLLLSMVTYRFAQEVAGRFDPWVYQFTTRFIPPLLDLILNTSNPRNLISYIFRGKNRLADRVILEGDTGSVCHYAKMGTLIFLPTHVSSLDSILMGLALFKLGLPPADMGATPHLFANKVIGFFMNNLGAYKINPKRRAKLYREVLKAYTSCTLEKGFHHVFFSWDKRMISQEKETHIDPLVLLAGVEAYIHNLMENREKADIFICPCTINYPLVLEAKTLVSDYIKEGLGLVEDGDEFSCTKRIFDFLSCLLRFNQFVYLVFGHVLDVFGNPVDHMGISLDPRGRRIDRAKYTLVGGKPCLDRQRDEQYAQELAQAVERSIYRITMILETNLLCYAVISTILKSTPDKEILQLIRDEGYYPVLSMVALREVYQSVLRKLLDMQSKGLIMVQGDLNPDGFELRVCKTLEMLNYYHIEPVFMMEKDSLYVIDKPLVYYYASRINNYLPFRNGIQDEKI